MMYDEIVYACAINRVFNFSSLNARKLIDIHPSPSFIFSLSDKELQEVFPNHPEIACRLQDKRLLESCAREIEWCHRYGIKAIFFSDREYPDRLRNCDDAPIILFYKGTADLNPTRAVSIVGTRRATSYGVSQCREIVRYLARLKPAPTIISGLAFGIDIAAHAAALENSLPTIAALPTGLDNIYPAQHREWAARIAAKGGIITDFHRNTTPWAVNFLRRNRIIAGMADAVILVESDIKGGGMVTARTAASYSRDVYAVPGRNTDRFSAGCNLLISNNEAAILTTPEELCYSLGWQKQRKGIKSSKANLNRILEEKNPIKRNILVILCDNSEADTDTIIDSIDAEASEVLSMITELELEGAIETDLYGRYKLVNAL